MLEITLTIGIFVVVIGLVYLMERRTKTKGALFAGQASQGMRLLAILLGILFAGISLYELVYSDSVLIWFPIIAAALFGYGFGGDRLLARLQGRPASPEKTGSPLPGAPQDETRLVSPRILRFLVTVLVILAVSAAVLYGCYWAATHPDNPFSIVIAVGLVVLVVLARVFDWFRFLKKLPNLFK